MITKVGILGTGVIGTLYGWALSERFDVKHIINEGHHNNIGPLGMDIIDERRSECETNVLCDYPPTIASPDEIGFDIIIVPVAEDKLEYALSDLSGYESPLLIMASNWDGLHPIEKNVPKQDYVLGYAGGGGTFIEKGSKVVLWGNIGADVIVGVTDESQKPLEKEVIEMFTSVGITPEDHGNVMHWLWMHNVDSAIIGAALCLHDDIESFVKDTGLIRTCFDAMSEGFRICAARGVDTATFPEVAMYSMPFEQLYPMFRDNMLQNPVMKRFTAHAFKAIPEMKNNFFKIYRCGKELGIDMPNLDSLNNRIESLHSLPKTK